MREQTYLVGTGMKKTQIAGQLAGLFLVGAHDNRQPLLFIYKTRQQQSVGAVSQTNDIDGLCRCGDGVETGTQGGVANMGGFSFVHVLLSFLKKQRAHHWRARKKGVF